MAQTKQTTLNVEGKKVVMKARNTGRGVHGAKGVGFLYSVSVNGWKTKVLVKLGDLDAETSEGMIDQALSLALEKGMAKWLAAGGNREAA